LQVPAGAIVVLGCPVRLDAGGRLRSSALSRRIGAAARTYEKSGDGGTVVVVSGGRHWGTALEADVMKRELVLRGIPPRAIVRERCSFRTLDNARFSAAILVRRGLTRALLVTCAWHVPRAVLLFAKAGIEADPVPVRDDGWTPWPRKAWRSAREGFLSWIERGPIPPGP
jgi:uncharacterized SAM-binding protein YcdF (DUF218 family)